ncbi:RNA methyltransferase [Pontibacter sp. G13]|uniref:RNA methyltransferase n=1 Tax=Pontibacter sp. G13 TaxID=3074898 RepID=UPI00288A3CCF|nr:RNA methyltransferase [Pontibacter sp. G13]WNJ19900.1 RNA methyltransferase [Pontibacter sp. G13]
MRKLKLEELGRMSVEDFKEAPKRPLIVILDNIRSMHNVGSVLRTADAFAIERVYLCGITPKPPHREIRKTAIGAEESVDWQPHDNAVELVRALKAEGVKIVSVEQTEGSIPLNAFTPESDAKYAMVMGHEVDGVDQEIINLSDASLEIPQFGTKHSLNVSVAAGITMYALSQQLG